MEEFGNVKPQTNEHYRIMEWLKEGGGRYTLLELVCSNQLRVVDDDDYAWIVTYLGNDEFDLEYDGIWLETKQSRIMEFLESCKGRHSLLGLVGLNRLKVVDDDSDIWIVSYLESGELDFEYDGKMICGDMEN